MKTRTVLILALLSFSSAACAKQPPKLAYPKLEPVVANMGPGCRVKLLIPAKSHYSSNYVGFTDQGVSNPSWTQGSLSFRVARPPYWNDEWNFGLMCHGLDAEQAKNDTVIFEATKNIWIANRKSDYYTIPQVHFKLYQIKTPNASGWAYTTDDTAVEVADKRLTYCVYHRDRAICGETDVGNVDLIRRYPLANRTPYVLKILNSIEFLEDAPPPSGNGNVHP